MSEGTLQPYEPTLRERSTKSVANFLRDKMGMDNYRSYELARNIFGDSSADSFLGSIGAATFSPAEAIFGGQEGARQYKRADDLLGKGIGAATVGLSALEAFPATALMAKGIKRMFPKSGATTTVESPSTQILKNLPEEDVQNLSFLIHEKQAAGIPTESLASVEKALDLSKNTSTKTPLYRGLYGEEIKYLGDVRKGDFINFDRYKSFSEKPDIAKGFGGTNVLLKANSSKGGFNYGDFVQESMKDYKKRSPTDYAMEDGDFIFDSAKEEAEWIFGRNKGFKITDVKKEGNFTVIEGDIEDAVDVDRRKVSKGIAALPIAATGIAKVISDLPTGAATATKAAVKSIPEVTGSSFLDKLPFVQKQLKNVYYLRKDSPQGDLQAIYHLEDMKTELEQLAGIPRFPGPSAKNKEELLDKPLDDFLGRVQDDKLELIDEVAREGFAGDQSPITLELIEDLMDMNPGMTLREAIKKVDDEIKVVLKSKNIDSLSDVDLEPGYLTDTAMQIEFGANRPVYMGAGGGTPDPNKSFRTGSDYVVERMDFRGEMRRDIDD